MDGQLFIKKCVQFVSKINECSKEDVYVITTSKVLKNNKCLLACKHNEKIYEMTFDGEKNQTYVDYYDKTANQVIKEVEDEKEMVSI